MKGHVAGAGWGPQPTDARVQILTKTAATQTPDGTGRLTIRSVELVSGGAVVGVEFEDALAVRPLIETAELVVACGSVEVRGFNLSLAGPANSFDAILRPLSGTGSRRTWTGEFWFWPAAGDEISISGQMGQASTGSIALPLAGTTGTS